MEPSPLSLAVLNNDIDKVRSILSKREPYKNIDSEHSALYLAIAKLNPDIVKLLLDAGANPNFQGQYNNQPTPLCMACSAGSIDTVQLLIEHGADVELINNGYGPLITAITQGKHDIAKYLIVMGASYGKIEQILLDPENADSITFEDSEINTANSVGITPLMAVAILGNTNLAQKFINQGADVNQRDIRKLSALGHSIINNKVDTVKLLIEHGTKVNKTGSLPYLLAITFSHKRFDMAKLLITTYGKQMWKR